MTPADLTTYQQVCEAATPGPWMQDHHFPWFVSDQTPIRKHIASVGTLSSSPDAKFIATFNPAVVLRLLGVVARQREALEEYGTHHRDCILSMWRAGEPTPGGTYRMNYGGTWYDWDKLPKCTCGYDAALAQDAEASK